MAIRTFESSLVKGQLGILNKTGCHRTDTVPDLKRKERSQGNLHKEVTGRVTGTLHSLSSKKGKVDTRAVKATEREARKFTLEFHSLPPASAESFVLATIRKEESCWLHF